MASCARGVWGKPSRSACEVTLGRGHWAGNATCRSAGPGAQVGAGEEAASQTSSPLKPVPTGGLGARAAQACRHIHLISCPLQTRAFSCYTLALASSSPATRGSPTQRRWAKCPSHRAWGGCPGFSIGEGTLISQDTCLIWQNLCRKSASALPERKGESSEGRYLALAVSPYLAEKVLERYRLHLASAQRGLAPVETEAVRSAAAEANTVRWEGGRRGGCPLGQSFTGHDGIRPAPPSPRTRVAFPTFYQLDTIHVLEIQATDREAGGWQAPVSEATFGCLVSASSASC